MQVVHALWTSSKKEGSGLFVWLEDEDLRKKNQLFEPISDFEMRPSAKKRTPSQQTTPEPHPFALGSKGLQDRIKALLKPYLGTNIGGIVTAIDVLLPSSGESPLPSPWLVKNKVPFPRRAKDLILHPWTLPGVFMAPPLALKWLVNLNLRRRELSAVYAESVHFWKDASNLVFYSLIHGTYEPVLQKVDHQIRSKWVLSVSILANQLENLQKRAPTNCEYEWSPDGTRRTKETIVHDFFDTSIDSLIRHATGLNVLDRLSRLRQGRRRKKQNPLDSLTLPMLKGLYSRQNSFSAARDVQAAFVALVSNWMQQNTRAQSKRWQLCFTVIPPDVGNVKFEELNPALRVWRIAFSLQNVRDPSQQIYAHEIWENLVSVETASGKSLAEFFLKEMGRALQYFPALREALQESAPLYLDISTSTAYRFLTEQCPHLQRAEFGVVLPTWWKKEPKRLTTKIELDSSSFELKGLAGFDSVVNFTWTASVDGKILSDKAFEKLVKHKMNLLPINGHWVELNEDDLWNTVSFFEDKKTNGEMSLREAMHMGIENEELKSAFDEVSIDFEGSLNQLFSSHHDSLPIVAQPKGLVGTLRPYQLRGLSWLAFNDQLGFGGCLADDMGLGKTIQLLSLLLHERETKQVKYRQSPTLLICPMSVVGNWHRETLKFTPSLRVMIHHGSGRHSDGRFQKVCQNYDLIITTYHLANRDINLFAMIDWHRIALDEAQNIKNPGAQQSRAICSLEASRRIALTGTPVENKLSELWSIMEFLNPGYMGNLKSFQTKYAIPIERQHDRKKAKLLRQLTQPFVLRRLKTDQNVIQDLPEKNEMKVYCDLTEEQAVMYKAYVQSQLDEIESAAGLQRNQLVFTTLMKLKQICNHPAHFLNDRSSLSERSGKLMRLTEMLEEALEENDKSLIFTQFTEMGNLLKSYLEKIFHQEVLFMHGGISQPRRQEMVDHFQSENGPRLFILTVKTGGTGLNLTAATHVFHYDRWWNPAVENQATDRAFRIGQKRNVQVHKLIAIGTLEDRIDMMIEKKKELAENVVGTDETWLTQLSTDSLKEVLTLSANEA